MENKSFSFIKDIEYPFNKTDLCTYVLYHYLKNKDKEIDGQLKRRYLALKDKSGLRDYVVSSTKKKRSERELQRSDASDFLAHSFAEFAGLHPNAEPGISDIFERKLQAGADYDDIRNCIIFVYSHSRGTWWIDKVNRSATKLMQLLDSIKRQLPDECKGISYALLSDGTSVLLADAKDLPHGITIQEVYES